MDHLRGELYVVRTDGRKGAIGQYYIETGAPIRRDFVTGLSIPLGVAVNQQNIFVLYFDPVALEGRAAKYAEVSGKLIKKDFITGLRFPNAIAVKR